MRGAGEDGQPRVETRRQQSVRTNLPQQQQQRAPTTEPPAAPLPPIFPTGRFYSSSLRGSRALAHPFPFFLRPTCRANVTLKHLQRFSESSTCALETKTSESGWRWAGEKRVARKAAKARIPARWRRMSVVAQGIGAVSKRHDVPVAPCGVSVEVYTPLRNRTIAAMRWPPGGAPFHVQHFAAAVI